MDILCLPPSHLRLQFHPRLSPHIWGIFLVEPVIRSGKKHGNLMHNFHIPLTFLLEHQITINIWKSLQIIIIIQRKLYIPGFLQLIQTAESLLILSMVRLEGKPGIWTALLPTEWIDFTVGTGIWIWLGPFSTLFLLGKTLLSVTLRSMFGRVLDFWTGIKDFITVLDVGGDVDFVGGTAFTGGGDGPFIRAVVWRVCGTFPDCRYECRFRF